MGFFDSLHQISKNRKHFSEWEKQQDEKQAKREVLYKQHNYTEAELENAKQYGKTIINVVDVMDNHSENVAENVETAFQPVVALVPFAAMFGTGWLSNKFIIDSARKKILNSTMEILNTNEAIHLADEIRNQENIKRSQKEIFTKSRLIRRIKSPELKQKAQKYFDQIAQATKKQRLIRNVGIALIPLSLIASHFGINVFASKVQVDSSKVARFQARQSLQDPKNFVEYTPEQIAQAKQEIADNPQLRKKKRKEDKKLRSGMIGSIAAIIKDNKAYRKDKKANKDDSQLITRPLSHEELTQAERDKEVIQRTIRLINNEAEKYSENMEVASGVIIGGTPFLGAAVGGITAWILNKTGIVKKAVDRSVRKDASEGTIKLYEELLATQKEKTGSISRKAEVLQKWSNFYQSLREDISNKIKPMVKGGEKQVKNLIPLNKEAKTLVTSLMAHNKIGGWAIAGVGALLTSVAGALIGLKLQKSSARAGRYTAKRELEKDPRNFIGYTDEEFNQIEKTPPKEKKSKFKEYATFIPTVLKQYRAYRKYQKHEFKENQLLNDQLKKQEVTEEQLSDAKNLQRKLFNTFEKVDDNSQQYSEATEAAIEIAQPYIAYGGIILAITPLAIIAAKIANGKISVTKVIEKISGFIGKSSKLANSKLFKKYLKGVEENIEHTIKNTTVNIKPAGTLLADVNLYEGSMAKNIKKLLENVKKLPEELEKYSEQDIQEFLAKLKERLLSSNKIIEKDNPIIKAIDEIQNMPKDKQIQGLKELLSQTDKLQVSDVLAQLPENIKNSDIMRQINDISIKDLTTKTKDVLQLLPADIKNKFQVENLINDFKTKLEKMSKEEFDEFLNKSQKFAGINGLNKESAVKILSNLSKAVKNIPTEEIKGIMEQCVKSFNEHPDEFIKLVRSGKIMSLFKTPTIENALVAVGVSWVTFSMVVTYIIESWLADIQLKAGRLGVMKSLESLEDPRYYANVEKDEQ